MDADVAIAKNIINLKYEDIPAEVIENTKRQVLDTLGVIAAASTMGEGSKEIIKLVKESGASGKSTIIGYGGQVPSWMAGLANGSMVHELDYDDAGGVHTAACTVPTAFALAEEVGETSGKELIVAVSAAVDLKFRMELAISGRDSSWMTPPLNGYFSATAVAGRILGLNENQMLDAFSHTLQQAAGSTQWQYSPGSVFRGIRDGFSIMGGILSALMAKRGLSGSRDSFEGKAGFYNLYFKGDYDRSCLIDGLGKKFENTGVGFKPWPSCMATHASIDATLGILHEHDISPSDIEEISVSVANRGESQNVQIETIEERRRPQTIIDAKFSIPFTLGIAATKRKVLISDFTLDSLKDSAVLRMADKVTIKVYPDLKDPRFNPLVEIRTKNGGKYSRRVDIVYGDFRKPISRDDLLIKFRDCVTYSLKPPSKGDTEQIIEMVNELEKIEDVSQIIRLLG